MRYLITITLFILLYSCHNNPSQDHMNLNFLEDKINTEFIGYQQLKKVDNRFNNTFIYDTLDVNVFMKNNNIISFRIKSKASEWFYNSGAITILDHNEQTKTVEKLDSESDLQNLGIWYNNLPSIIDSIQLYESQFRKNDYTKNLYLKNRYTSQSKSDSNSVVINEFQYDIPDEKLNILKQKSIITRDSDTLQILINTFQKIHTAPQESLSELVIRFKKNDYAIASNENDLPFGSAPIKEGDTISNFEYNDINGKLINLTSNRYTLLIFSFIGCTPCETALSDLSKSHKSLKNNLNIYYSSFQNNNELLKKYLKNKSFLKNSFGKESNMINDFRLPVGPTFVIINPEGKVEKIIEGYDDTVLTDLQTFIKARKSN